jgi:hypothetical protein
VRNLGVTSSFFSDHTDVRPTIMSLVGLDDDYTHDGRVLVEAMNPSALPQSLRTNHTVLLQLGQAYKQINAPFGDLGKNTLKISTVALKSSSRNDFVYRQLEGLIDEWTERRDALASQMKEMLEDAEFKGDPIDDDRAERLIFQANVLLFEARFVAQIL